MFTCHTLPCVYPAPSASCEVEARVRVWATKVLLCGSKLRGSKLRGWKLKVAYCPCLCRLVLNCCLKGGCCLARHVSRHPSYHSVLQGIHHRMVSCKASIIHHPAILFNSHPLQLTSPWRDMSFNSCRRLASLVDHVRQAVADHASLAHQVRHTKWGRPREADHVRQTTAT